MTRTNLTHSEFYDLAVNKIAESADNKPTYFGVGSVARALVQAFSYIAEFLQLQINLTYQSFRTKTATGLHLDRRLQDFDLTRNSATFAQTTQTFLGSSGRVADIVIPQGFVVTTVLDMFGNTKNYALNSAVILTSGSASATGIVVCTKSGKIGNTPSGTITRIPTSLAGITGVINYETVSNGANEETDEEFLSRLPNHISGRGKGTNFAITAAAESVPGITYAKLKPNSPVPGLYTLYISNDSGEVDTTLRQAVINEIESVNATCISYSIITPTIVYVDIAFTLSLDTDTYNSDTLSQRIKSELKSYINNIRRNELYISDIIYFVRSLTGVNNVKSVTISGVASDLILDDFEVVKVNNVSNISITLE